MTTMLVAISGGHLMQLRMLSRRVAGDDDVIWMTDDTAQSRSLLAGEKVYHVPTRPPRDYQGVLRDTRIAGRAISDHKVDRIISTGAQIALSALVPASARRIPFTYIESATRVTGVSIDREGHGARALGRPLRAVPARGDAEVALRPLGVRRIRSRAVDRVRPLERAVVTVGGNGDYGFRRLIDGAREGAA